MWSRDDSSLEDIPESSFVVSGYQENLPDAQNGLMQFGELIGPPGIDWLRHGTNSSLLLKPGLRSGLKSRFEALFFELPPPLKGS